MAHCDCLSEILILTYLHTVAMGAQRYCLKISPPPLEITPSPVGSGVWVSANFQKKILRLVGELGS